MARMSEQELRAIVAAEKAAALSALNASDLSRQRARAMDYYLSDMTEDMPDPAGRSTAVSSDVADTIESILPALMEIFAGGDEIVRFNPVGPEDEAAAAQETDYLNHVFHQDNPGFLILYTMFKDALLQKTGIVKFWWEAGERTERETYAGQPAAVYEVLAGQEDVEIGEHATHPAPDGTGALLHDFVVERRTRSGRARCLGVPPEEFLIARRARSVADAPYLAHRVRRTQSELIEMGYDRATVEALPTAAGDDGEEAAARQKGLRRTGAGAASIGDDGTGAGDANRAMRPVDVVEHYIRVDVDGDGVAELRKVTTAGGADVILDNEPFDAMPFAVISPILLPHRVIGLSVADLVLDIQKVKTALYRAVLDNAYFMNNQRLEISETHSAESTLDDLLTNRPGGIVRTRMPGGLNPIPTSPIGPTVFPLIDYLDAAREQRTGVAMQQPGPDANALQNQTATAANIASAAAQARIRLIARIFAETGVKDLFIGLHRLILEHGRDEKARVLRLRNRWVTVDPSDWRRRSDMTVTVGLGTGNRDQMLAHLQTILGMQVQAIQMQGGAGGPIVTLPNIHKTLCEIARNAGFRNPDAFFSDPATAAPAPPAGTRPDPKMVDVEGRLQIEQQRARFDMQHQQAVAAAEQQRQAMKTAAEHQREADRLQADMAAAAARAELDQATALAVEKIRSATAIEVARINAGHDLAATVQQAVVAALATQRTAAGDQGLA
jgi:hypothetical protein